MRKRLIAGNWKMNGRQADIAVILDIGQGLSTSMEGKVETVICPPATLLATCRDALEGFTLALGAQDCHAAEKGAYTGDLSAAMLCEAGASYIILGHSERRAVYHESDELVRRKSEAALAAGAIPIICIGETLSEREAGDTLLIVERQLAGSVPASPDPQNLVIAYEPVWAIGTGLTPTIKQIAEVHRAVRRQLVARFGDAGEHVRILYGGSMKPDNAAEILGVPDVDGGLIGGASLNADSFLAIAHATPGV